MQDIIYKIAFSRLFSFSPQNALLLYQSMPSLRDFFEQGIMPDSITTRVENRLREALLGKNVLLEEAQREWEFCQQKKISILSFEDDDYPALLRQCPDAPLLLFYLGTANLNAPHSIAVVGTRKITDYGRNLCRNFCEELQSLLPDALIVSGLAYGVDIHVHRESLKQKLPTVGVLAHGLDLIYPSLHRSTASQMVAEGGLLTEYSTQTQPRAENFVRRNRIVAGMCATTVVIESASKGGALITAQLAQDYNRSVFAFPGRVGDEYSEGCNNLIRHNGAMLLTSASQLVSEMNWQTTSTPIQRELFPELSTDEMAVFHCLSDCDRKSVNQMVIELNIPIHKLSALLFDMEMRGLVAPTGGGCYRWLK